MDGAQDPIVKIPGQQQSFFQTFQLYVLAAIYVICAISPLGWLYWMVRPVALTSHRMWALYRLLSSCVAIVLLLLVAVVSPIEGIDIVAIMQQSPVWYPLFISAWAVAVFVACDNGWHTINHKHIIPALRTGWIRMLVYTYGVIGYCVASAPFTFVIWYPGGALVYRLVLYLQ